MKRIDIPKVELKRLYEKEKFTTYQIAEIYDCCQATIWKRLHTYGIKPRTNWNYIKIPKKELERLYVKKRLSSRKIAKIYNCVYFTIDRKIRQYGFKIRNLAEAHIIYPRKDFSGNLEEKAYLIGFALGDLRVRKIYKNSETVYIDCGSTKREQIILIKNLFQPYGRVWISRPNKKGARQIQVHLNLSFSFLLKKRVDNLILNTERYFAAFLAGFTDAEGSISIRKNGQAVYQLGNYDIKLLNKIYHYLLNFKIKCRPPRSDNRKGKINNEGYVYKQNYWHFTINAKRELIKLFDLIEPHIKHVRKRKAIKKARRNIDMRNRKYGYVNMEA